MNILNYDYLFKACQTINLSINKNQSSFTPINLFEESPMKGKHLSEELSFKSDPNSS